MLTDFAVLSHSKPTYEIAESIMLMAAGRSVGERVGSLVSWLAGLYDGSMARDSARLIKSAHSIDHFHSGLVRFACTLDGFQYLGCSHRLASCSQSAIALMPLNCEIAGLTFVGAV